MPSLGNSHCLERKIWPQWGDRLGEKFPTDANQLMELCHPGGSTLRTGLCELNRNSEHEFYQNVSQFSLLREWELCTGNVCVVCVCRGVYAYVCLWWECVYVWWGCMRVCVCTCLMRVCGWWGCVCVWWGCVCVVRVCVCDDGARKWDDRELLPHSHKS